MQSGLNVPRILTVRPRAAQVRKAHAEDGRRLTPKRSQPVGVGQFSKQQQRPSFLERCGAMCLEQLGQAVLSASVYDAAQVLRPLNPTWLRAAWRGRQHPGGSGVCSRSVSGKATGTMQDCRAKAGGCDRPCGVDRPIAHQCPA